MPVIATAATAATAPVAQKPTGTTIGTQTYEYKPPTMDGKSQYDIQREKVQSDAEKEQQRRQEALSREFASRGTQDSGIAIKAGLEQQRGIQEARAGALSQIDVSQLQAAEQAAQTQAGREFQASQTELERGLQRELTYADLNLREQGLFEEARQFDSELDFQSYALEGGWNQDEIQRAWQASQNESERELQRELTYADLSQQERQLAEQSRQFDSKEAFDRYALEQGIAQEVADRSWQASQSQLDREQQTTLQNVELTQDNAQFLSDLNLRQEIAGDQSDQWRTEMTQRTAELAQLQNQFDVSTGLERERLGQEMEALQAEITSRMELLNTELAAQESLALINNTAEEDQLRLQIDANSQDLLTELTSRESMHAADLQRDYTALKDAYDQFNASQGLDRERLAQELVVQRGDYLNSMRLLERQLSAEESMEELKYLNTLGLNEQMAGFEGDIARLESDLAIGEMDYAQMLDLQKEQARLKSEYWFNLGASASPLDAQTQKRMHLMQWTDPMSYYAYQSGTAGMAREEFMQSQEFTMDYVNSLIAGLDTESPAFAAAVNQIYAEMGVSTIDEIAGEPSSSTNPYALATSEDIGYANLSGASDPAHQYNSIYDNLIDTTDPWVASYKKNTSGANSWEFDNMPPVGEYFTVGGKLYYSLSNAHEEVALAGQTNRSKVQIYDVDSGETLWMYTPDTSGLTAPGGQPNI